MIITFLKLIILDRLYKEASRKNKLVLLMTLSCIWANRPSLLGVNVLPYFSSHWTLLCSPHVAERHVRPLDSDGQLYGQIPDSLMGLFPSTKGCRFSRTDVQPGHRANTQPVMQQSGFDCGETERWKIKMDEWMCQLQDKDVFLLDFRARDSVTLKCTWGPDCDEWKRPGWIGAISNLLN